MSLPDYISSSSTGQYNFTFNVNVTNQGALAVAPEICVICVNSGMMVTNQGVSSTYSGLLTKEMVLSAKSKDHYSTMDEIRKVGGQFLNRCARPFRKPVGSGMSGDFLIQFSMLIFLKQKGGYISIYNYIYIYHLLYN
jgi:hypothetical protein